MLIVFARNKLACVKIPEMIEKFKMSFRRRFSICEDFVYEFELCFMEHVEPEWEQINTSATKSRLAFSLLLLNSSDVKYCFFMLSFIQNSLFHNLLTNKLLFQFFSMFFSVFSAGIMKTWFCFVPEN